ncbi:MAG: hypothetical protein ABSG82_03740 [Sedimentisphaerales bacterium]|jgi:hypothetical protein
MFLDKMPKVFFNAWLWIGIAAVLLAIRYFFGKPQQPRKPSEFYLKHKKTIMRTTDVFLILVILFGWIPLIYSNELIMGSVAVFAVWGTITSGISGGLIGLLSVFQSNLTRRKRLILFVVSILPVCFTILALMTVRFDEPETIWLTAKLGFWASVFCWLINGSAIITGQRFTRIVWSLMRKLKLVSGEFPE